MKHMDVVGATDRRNRHDTPLCRGHAAALLAEGKSPEQVAVEFAAMGWHAESARRLVGEARAGNGATKGAPAPDLRGLPSCVRIGGRLLKLQARTHRPDACLFGNFASRAECAAIVDAARPALVRSQVIVADGELAGNGAESYHRTSDQAVMQRGTHAVVDRLAARLARLVEWPVGFMENPQVVRYRPGEDFSPHQDFFDAEAHRERIQRDGQRLATAILYLNTPPQGGMTTLLDAEMEIYPHAGSLLLFSYANADETARTRHSGVPVPAGEKWILTFFLRDRAYPASRA
jgi:prolyl 4-hydroxylase